MSRKAGVDSRAHPISKSLMVIGLIVLVSVAAKPGFATIPLFEGETLRLDLSGYLRTFSAVQHTPYDTLGLMPTNLGLNINALRLEWRADIGDHVTLQIHNRLLLNLTSSAGVLGSAVGIGVSTPPERWIDLQSDFFEDDQNLSASHDIDRLALQLYTGPANITIGRQAVTWGIAKLFPVADLWTTFSPFEMDTAEKRGVDAIRGLITLSERIELDLIIADRNGLENLSGGARLVMYLQSMDLHLACGKLWNQLMAFGGVATDLGELSLYLDVVLPFNLDDEELLLPSLTLGLDVYSIQDLFLSLEYTFNGAGVGEAEQYLGHFTDPRLQRGETYLLGRHYAGLLANYRVTNLISLSLTSLVNLQDPSVIVGPSATYDLSEEVDISLGAFMSFGEAPLIELPRLDLKSEFGTYPDTFYLHIVGYF